MDLISLISAAQFEHSSMVSKISGLLARELYPVEEAKLIAVVI